MEAEAWEALDLDDSDIYSLLRPCKREPQLPPSPNPKKSFNRNTPFLELCSLRSSQTVTPHSSPPPPSPPIYPHPIPGPAGAVQAAMLRKIRNDPNSFGVDGEPIPTQEYIRRAVEDLGGNDDDFSRNTWLFAVDFIRSEGLVGDDGVAIGTPLSVIKREFSMDKVDQVVAIVKSCTPNGQGDLMVTLKDPTGTIEANIHHRVLTENEFGKDICIGAVLILHKVAVFAPSRFARYLNITLSNMVKVIRKDSGPPLKQNYPALTVRNFAPVVENSKHSWMQQKALLSLTQGRSEGIMNSLRQNANLSGMTHFDKEMEEGDSVLDSNCQSDGSRKNQNAVVGKQSLLARQDAVTEMQTVAIGTSSITDNDQEDLVNEQANPWTQAVRGSQLDSVQSTNAATNLVEVPNQENVTINGIKKQRQPEISRGSLPQWTDEQLDELFEFD